MSIRPVLVYDGDCAFCSRCVALAERRLRLRCAIVPWQRADLASLGVDRRRAEHEVLWITPPGVVYGGAEAVAKLLLSGGGAWAVAGALLRMPPIRWIAGGVYRVIADNRDRMPGGTPACALPAEHKLR